MTQFTSDKCTINQHTGSHPSDSQTLKFDVKLKNATELIFSDVDDENANWFKCVEEHWQATV